MEYPAVQNAEDIMLFCWDRRPPPKWEEFAQCSCLLHQEAQSSSRLIKKIESLSCRHRTISFLASPSTSSISPSLLGIPTNTMNSNSQLLAPSSSMDSTVCTIAAMRNQEEKGYLTSDSLAPGLYPFKLDVDADCRKKMVAWSYQVVDFCKFNRESVEISMSYLDRFLATPAGVAALQDRSFFQLAAMASLYTAVKIHEPEAMDPKLVSSLSRGTYSPEDVEQMEYCLLTSLQWRMNPPTSLSFVRQFFNLIPTEAMDEISRNLAYDIAKFQTELAVSDYDFCSIRASETAYCALINALESLDLDPKVISYMSLILQKATGINGATEGMLQVQSYLYAAVVRQPELLVQPEKCTNATSPVPAKPKKLTVGVSPRTALQHC